MTGMGDSDDKTAIQEAPRVGAAKGLGGAALFGVRHHGPGCARDLLRALEELQPAEILIEGPSDASHLLPMAAEAGMVPPVALLVYDESDPAQAVFWPFARFSPEWAAILWGLKAGVPVRFIDLPAALVLNERFAPSEEEAAEEAPETDGAATEIPAEEAPPSPPPAEASPEELLGLKIRQDPIGVLAEAAGYEDGESWWLDLIEQNPEPGPIFAAIAEAMSALRAAAPPPDAHEAAREAHMRLAVAESVKAAGERPVAVVCGAWHVPALLESRPQKDDRALIPKAAKRKLVATWAPWSFPRLARNRGYGAGVEAPGWLDHLWETPPEQIATRWLARIAAAIRAEGNLVSTASLIEATRLSTALAALRERPTPGFEEMREAAVACLCEGRPAIWHLIAEPLLIGAAVGEIPEGAPLTPLIADLQRWQKKLKLKPEALDSQKSLDLRSNSGLDASTLLHRLKVIGVPWGRLEGAGRSRGTFRENWTLRWEPDFAVRLVEALAYGSTVAEAAAGKLAESFAKADSLAAMAELVMEALTIQSPTAADTGVALLERRAAETGDAPGLLAALPPLADALRYGGARAVNTERLESLFRAMALRGALSLPYAARNLDAEASGDLRDKLRAAEAALNLAEIDAETREIWISSLRDVADHEETSPLIAGVAAQILAESGAISPEDMALRLRRALSPGVPVAAAAGFFEGFFQGGALRLIQDPTLREAVDGWLLELDEENFIESLPLLRRVFSEFDAAERKRLFAALFGKPASGPAGLVAAPDLAALWPRHEARILGLLTGGEAP